MQITFVFPKQLLNHPILSKMGFNCNLCCKWDKLKRTNLWDRVYNVLIIIINITYFNRLTNPCRGELIPFLR